MNFRSVCDLARDVRLKLLPQIPRDVGTVYGIPRSGMLPASLIATAIGARLAPVGGPATAGQRLERMTLSTGRKNLLVDDSLRTGRAMRAARERCESLGVSIDYTCAVYSHPTATERVDFVASIVDTPRVFEWNFMGTKATESFCWDLDGAICTDPRVVDDDGPAYAAEITFGVQPLYVPHVPVLAIVTNRIERWRETTEHWLGRHGIVAATLAMRSYDSAASRRNHMMPAEFKAERFVALGGSLFIESSDAQAKMIAELSGRPVLGLERMRLHEP